MTGTKQIYALNKSKIDHLYLQDSPAKQISTLSNY